MVIIRYNKIIKFILVLLFFCHCRKNKILNDDELTIHRNSFSGSQLNINGYYYNKFGSPEKLTIYVFFNNGILLHTGDSWEYEKLYEFEEFLQTNDFINKLKAIKYAWGVFKIDENEILFERWYPGQSPLKAYIRKGQIINDTTFIITESYRMQKNKKTDICSRNETYHFRQFSPKPDSTNNFIK